MDVRLTVCFLLLLTTAAFGQSVGGQSVGGRPGGGQSFGGRPFGSICRLVFQRITYRHSRGFLCTSLRSLRACSGSCRGFLIPPIIRESQFTRSIRPRTFRDRCCRPTGYNTIFRSPFRCGGRLGILNLWVITPRGCSCRSCTCR